MLGRDSEEREGDPGRGEKGTPIQNRTLCSAPAPGGLGPGLAGQLHSHAGHSLHLCYRFLSEGPMYSLANVSSAKRARCGCGQTDASPSLPLEKQIKRHAFLKAIRREHLGG